MALTTAGKNLKADAINYTHASLHDGAPGDLGENNELSGGSPAYARKALTFGAADDGVREADNDVTFDIPPGSDVTHFALWAGAVCVETGAVSNPESYNGQGTHILKDGVATTE